MFVCIYIYIQAEICEYMWVCMYIYILAEIREWVCMGLGVWMWVGLAVCGVRRVDVKSFV